MQLSGNHGDGRRSPRRTTSGKGLGGVLAVAAAALLLVPTAAQASFPGRNGRIAYTQLDSAYHSQIRTVGPNGGRVRTLTPARGSASDPAFSANGKWIAYSDFKLHRASATDIYRMRSNGRHKRRLTGDRHHGHLPAVQEDSPVFSPNGKWIAFVRRTSHGPTIFKMKRNGHHVRRLSRGRRRNDTGPSWSPNGRWIAFTRTNKRGKTQIYRMRPNGKHAHRVTAGVAPSWSPNGRRIAYHRYPPHNAFSRREIFTVRPNGHGRRQITHLGSVDALYPSFSPGGHWITFVRGGGEVWKVRANGRGLTKVVAQPAGAGGMSFTSWQAR